ncbi:hypothetical protein BGZ94_000574 [Podila epigama]|nr:hypothetical protein BGZ94_000574 [Podila epigama]
MGTQKNSSGHEGGSFRSSRKRGGQPVEIKFSRATEAVNHSMSIYGDDDSDNDEDDDQGHLNDSDDGSEDGYFMEGEFEWEEGDQDPALKYQKTIQERNNKVDKTTLANTAPLTSWGGALTYQVQPMESDTSSLDGTSTTVVQETVSAVTSRLKENGDQAMGMDRSTALRNRIKKPRLGIDLTEEIAMRMDAGRIADGDEEEEEEGEQETLMWVLDPTPSHPLTTMATTTTTTTTRSTESTSATATSVETVSAITVATSVEASSISSSAIVVAPEEEPMMWVIDTEPTEINEKETEHEPTPTFVELPPEQLWSSKVKKAKRSKRGGRKLKEKEKLQKLARRVAVGDQEDDLMLLEEPESEVDDEMLAMEDYLLNTMDPDNPDQFDSLLGSLRGPSSGFGHSSEIGGLDADDSDFEQDVSEDDSLDGGDHEDMDFAYGYMPKSKSKSNSSMAFDLEDIPASSFIGGRKKKGKNAPHGGNLETLSELNRAIEDFVRDDDLRQLQLPPMPKALRRKVHLLAENYNLESQSLGSGKNRAPMLVRTHQTRLPPHPVNVKKLLNQSEQELKMISIQRRMNKHEGGRGGRGGGGGSRRGGSRRDKDDKGGGATATRPAFGSVVGGEASAISTENKGHRMLAKMGWSPGVGLGATGEGIIQPIEAVMRAKRRGLGHE